MKKIKQFQDKNIVITGGSSGIGLAIAHEFAKRKANLFLVARNEEKLKAASEQLKNKWGQSLKVFTFSTDVSLKNKVENTMNVIGQELGGIDVLINNAGMSFWGTMEQNSSENLEYAMQVNYFGMIYSIKAAWKYLKESPEAHIGFVSSVGGYLGAYGYTHYSPTKFSVTGLAECLRMEAKDYNIGVTIIFPPDTRTPMLEEERKHSPLECLALSSHSGIMEPETVAQQFIFGIEQNHFEVLCNLESRLLRIFRCIWPKRYFRFLDSIIENDRKKRKQS